MARSRCCCVLSLGLGLKLHLALRRLRDDNTDFDRLIGAIDGATDRARSVLDDLKRAAGDAGERLGGDLGQAQRVLDDLRFLCERGERLADGLAGQIEFEPRAAARARRMLLQRALDRRRRLPIWSARSGPCDESGGPGRGGGLGPCPAGPWSRPRCSRRSASSLAAKIALLAQDAVRALSAPALPETPVVTGKAAAAPDMEPAAGPGENTSAASAPEREAARPAPQAEPARAPAGPAPRLALDRLSQSEIEVLQQLAERRAALERREQELDRRAALLATAEANVATQLERLEQLRAEIAATIATHDAKEDAKLASLVKIYETMKPKAAAEIFDRLEMPILIRVVERMRAPNRRTCWRAWIRPRPSR